MLPNSFTVYFADIDREQQFVLTHWYTVLQQTTVDPQ